MRRDAKGDLVHPVSPQDGYKALAGQRGQIRELYAVLSQLCESKAMTRGEAKDLIRTLTGLVRAKRRTKPRQSKRLPLKPGKREP